MNYCDDACAFDATLAFELRGEVYAVALYGKTREAFGSLTINKIEGLINKWCMLYPNSDAALKEICENKSIRIIFKQVP